VNNSLPQSQWNNPNPNPMKNGVVPLPAPLAVPTENWVPQPWVLRAALTAQGLEGYFDTVPGYTYALQCSASLEQTTNQWTNLFSTNGIGSLTTMAGADAATNSMRFYRLSRQPAL
jgi:hypothetical protein